MSLIDMENRISSIRVHSSFLDFLKKSKAKRKIHRFVSHEEHLKTALNFYDKNGEEKGGDKK